MDYFEHERNMEHPMYKKGFQYVFDHYGVPRLPSEELIDLRKEHKKLLRKLVKANDQFEEIYTVGKKAATSLTYYRLRNKEMRAELKKVKGQLKSAQFKLKQKQSKWHNLKAFFSIK